MTGGGSAAAGTAVTLLVAALAASVAFAFTNGFHDAANAVAALVVTRAARPGPAVALAAVGDVTGALLFGAAVAGTVEGIVRLPAGRLVAVVGAAVTAALVWNLATWWRGLPSSSSHALVGGLVGAGLVRGGWHALRWGGMHGVHPVGVLGVLVALAVSPPLGFLAGFVLERLARRATRRATRRVATAARRGEWVTAGALAFSHGANDAQKTIGVMTVVLVAGGHLGGPAAPVWVKLLAAGAMALGTATGGWRIVRTVGRGIYRVRALDGLASQAGSAAVILASAAVGGPTSTTHVVASSVTGVGASRRRRHVHWPVAGDIAAAWLVTLPATALLGAVLVPLWGAV